MYRQTFQCPLSSLSVQVLDHFIMINLQNLSNESLKFLHIYFFIYFTSISKVVSSTYFFSLSIIALPLIDHSPLCGKEITK